MNSRVPTVSEFARSNGVRFYLELEFLPLLATDTSWEALDDIREMTRFHLLNERVEVACSPDSDTIVRIRDLG